MKKKKQYGINCRFGFPRPPMKKTVIFQPLLKEIDTNLKRKFVDSFKKIQDKLIEFGRKFKEDIRFDEFLKLLDITYSDYIMSCRSSIKNTTVFLKRSTNASFINNYNRQLLRAWKANIDIQFILDTYACAKY